MFALPVIFAGFWFFGNMISAPTRRLKYLESIRNIDSQPQIAAVPYLDCSYVDQKQLDQNSLCSTGHTYGKYDKSEISSASCNDFLVTGGSDSAESANTILRIRGGGSGGGSGISTAGISTAGISTAGTSTAGTSTAARLGGRTSISRGEGSVTSGAVGRGADTSSAVGRGAGTSSAGGRNLNPLRNPLRTSTRDSTSDLFFGVSSNSRVQDRSGGGRSSWLSSCLEAASNCSVCGDTDLDKASVPAYQRAFEPPFEQMMERDIDSPTAKYRDPNALHFTYEDKVRILVTQNKTFGVICEGRIEEARITGQPDETKINQFRFGRRVFLNCALGEKREICFRVLQKEINDVNEFHKQQDSDFASFVLHESDLEKANLQARFCLDKGHGEVLEVIIYAKQKNNDISNVNVIPVNEILYNERDDVLNIVKQNREQIVQTLPLLASVEESKWQLEPKHDYNHCIGSADAANMGMFYDKSVTQYLPRKFNTSRPMDHHNTDQGASIKFATTIEQDSVKESRHLFNPHRSDNLYKEHTDNLEIPPGVKVQQESAAAEKFQESAKYIEKKGRCYRADLTALGELSEAEIKEYGVRGINDSSGRTHFVFESQKLAKAQKNCSKIIAETLSQLDTNYEVSDRNELLNLINELKESFVTLTKLGEIESNVLGLSRGQHEINCSLGTLRTDLKSKQDEIINAIVQLHVHNGNPTTTHEQIKAEMAPILKDIVDNSIIHDPTSFAKNMDNASQIIQQHGLDQNRVNPHTSIFRQSSALKKHINEFSKKEINQVRNANPGLTGYLVPGQKLLSASPGVPGSL